MGKKVVVDVVPTRIIVEEVFKKILRKKFKVTSSDDDRTTR